MGRRSEKNSRPRSHTLPSSPTHSLSSSSSDFEFTISLSPRKSSTALCPADELFYKGQLLPLHLSPRLTMVRTLLLRTSSSTSSATTATTTTTTTASRHSTGSSSNDSRSSFSGDLIDSSRPSSVSATDEDELLRRINHHHHHHKKSNKYFSAFSKFSSVFRKEPKTQTHDLDTLSGSSVKRMSVTAKEVICKYFKKVKPLYEKLSQKNQNKLGSTTTTTMPITTYTYMKDIDISMHSGAKDENGSLSHSFSGNLRYPRRKRSCISSCPSSMRSSPSRSGITTCRNGVPARGVSHVDNSSMEELHSAIQGAIAHCKNSMIETKGIVSN